MGSNSVKQFPSGRLNRSKGECSLDRQNTVVENLGVSHTQGLSRQKAEAGHFLIRWQKPGHHLGVKDRVPILEDQRMDLKEQGEGVEKREPSNTAGRNVNWCSHSGGQLWKFLKKTKNRVTIWPSNPTPGHILRENCNSKRYMYLNVHSSTIYNSQHIEMAQVPINRWLI